MNYRDMKNIALVTVISILLISCSKDEQNNDETNKNEQYNIKIEANTNVSVKDTIVIGNKKITIK